MNACRVVVCVRREVPSRERRALRPTGEEAASLFFKSTQTTSHTHINATLLTTLNEKEKSELCEKNHRTTKTERKKKRPKDINISKNEEATFQKK